MRTFGLTAVLLALVGLTGCAAYPVNERQATLPDPRESYALINPNLGGNDPDTIFLVTFSGGGTRAAAYAYGVLEEMARTERFFAGRTTRMLDEIDAITSVSGGSFTAAYYGLFGDRIFEDFEDKFLNQNVQGILKRNIILPFSWPKLLSPYYGRSELAADLYDKILFEGKTYRDLLERGGPVIVINATDIALGAQFSFSAQTFRFLCSNLLDFPVSRAVAASSAVPILFNTVVLKNYAGGCDLTVPAWLNEVLVRRDTASRQYNKAALMTSYLQSQVRPYVHLLDGGLSDNLGVRALLDNVFVRGGAWQTLTLANLQGLSKIVVLVVNAETAINLKGAKKDTSLGIFDTILAASAVPLNYYNFESLTLLRSQLDDWEGQIADLRCREFARLKAAGEPIPWRVACSDIETYLIEVDLNLERDPERRAYLQTLPTSFSLEPEAVSALRESAGAVLRESAEYQRLLKDLRQPP